jgi:hypothetical protein
MFYKSSNRSTVLDRQESHRNDHINPSEDPQTEHALSQASRDAEQAKRAKLSVFEKELLQAWFQD